MCTTIQLSGCDMHMQDVQLSCSSILPLQAKFLVNPTPPLPTAHQPQLVNSCDTPDVTKFMPCNHLPSHSGHQSSFRHCICPMDIISSKTYSLPVGAEKVMSLYLLYIFSINGSRIWHQWNLHQRHSCPRSSSSFSVSGHRPQRAEG